MSEPVEEDRRAVESAAVQILAAVWRGANASTGHSWERLNHSMRAALELAVGSGAVFNEGDTARIHERFRPWHWVGPDWEWVYAVAVLVGNRSAVEELERHLKRRAFIADGVELGERIDRHGFLHKKGRRQRERLVVGATFTYGDVRPTATSFNDESGYLTACTYRAEPKVERRCRKCHHITEWPRQVLDRRLTITHRELRDDRRARKEAKP